MIEWVKQHPYLAGGFVLAAFVLIIVMRNRSATAQSAGNAQVINAGPSDSIQAMEIQAGATIDQAQIAANVATIQANAANANAALGASVATTQILAGQDVSNKQTSAALTLGLANDGDSTSSIVSLLQAQQDPFRAGSLLTSGVGGSTGGPTMTPIIVGIASNPIASPTPSGNPPNVVNNPGLWPTVGAMGLNDLANSLAQSAQASNEPTYVAGTPSTVTDLQGVQLPTFTCPPGYLAQNGGCYAADYSQSTSQSLAQEAALEQQGYVPDPLVGWVPGNHA